MHERLWLRPNAVDHQLDIRRCVESDREPARGDTGCARASHRSSRRLKAVAIGFLFVSAIAAGSCQQAVVPQSVVAVGPSSASDRWLPAPYRYLPDRVVDGWAAVGQAESWSPSTSATLVRRGPFVLDQGALLGLNAATRQGIIEYFGAVADMVAKHGQPPSFHQWVLHEGQWGGLRCGNQGHIQHWFPSNFEVSMGGTSPVPLKLLPSPAVIQIALGPRLELVRVGSLESLVAAGIGIGRTVVYEHGALRSDFLEGKENGARLFRVLPMATPAASRSMSTIAPMMYAPQYGRLVIPNTENAWRAAVLAVRRDGGAGARYFGEVQTIALGSEIFLRRVIDADGHLDCPMEIVYELWDGLGGLRCDAAVAADPLAVPVTMIDHDGGDGAKLGGHEIFRAPLPLPRVASPSGWIASPHPQECIVIGESWSSRSPPVVAVRKGETWEPYCESLVFESNQTGAALRDGSLLMLGVFSNIQPAQLVELMARFAGIDPAPISGDAEFMESLQQRYTRVNPDLD